MENSEESPLKESDLLFDDASEGSSHSPMKELNEIEPQKEITLRGFIITCILGFVMLNNSIRI